MQAGVEPANVQRRVIMPLSVYAHLHHGGGKGLTSPCGTPSHLPMMTSIFPKNAWQDFFISSQRALPAH